MLREQTGDHWNLVDGKYTGVSYKTEGERMAQEKDEKWKKTLAMVKVSSVEDLIRSISSHYETHHASAVRNMPPMNGTMFAAEWFGETFGLTSEDDCVEAFQFSREEGLIVGDYDEDSEGMQMLKCFRGVNTKSPIV